jgi:hypothetical protein
MSVEEMSMAEWVRVPVIDPINPVNVWEHTPLDYARGEYPRFIRPPGPRLGDHPWRWERVADSG